MSDYYLDASALMKRYVDEVGSTWVRQMTAPLTAAMVEHLPIENPLGYP